MTLITKALAEMAGTFVMIFVGGSSIFLYEKYPAVFPSFTVALTFGTIIAAMILVFGVISGAHFNPAVTLAFAITKRFPVSQIPAYWISQCLGGSVAAYFLILMRKI